MNQRTRVLLSVMIVVGLCMLADYGYGRWFREPAAAHERAMTGLAKKIDDLKVRTAAARKAARELPQLEARSLPYSVEMAQAGYQEWLLQLVKSADLANRSVTADSPAVVSATHPTKKKPTELYKRYSYTVRGRGDLRQVSQLLFSFYQGGFLHKIASVSMNPVDGGRQIDLTLRIEALGLSRCDRSTEMPQPGPSETRSSQLADYELITRRNIFSPEGDAMLGRIVFTGISYDRMGAAETWLTITGAGGTRVLKRGDSIVIGPHRLELVDLQGDRVLLLLDGELRLVELGKSVKSGRVIRAPAPKSTVSAEETQIPPRLLGKAAGQPAIAK